MSYRFPLAAVLWFSLGVPPLSAADWPMWRYDANRSGATPDELPTLLHLQWMREYPPLQPAWTEQDKMPFDIAYEPIVVGKMLYLNSSRHDCVRALDTTTGAERWTFFADGPVRFAPVAWGGRVYFSADDGYLYCLDGVSGRLQWKFRGGPAERHILGNERLISTWPARGAPVVADDTVYFAASIWPFMGIFIHALDARTGEVKWTNDGDGSLYMKQPHMTDAFASIAPQGPLVVSGETLLLPGGRSVPACFDRRTGKLLRYQLADNGKRGGGSEVAAIGSVFFNGGALFDLATEKYHADYGKHMVMTPDVLFTVVAGSCRAYDLKAAGLKEVEGVDKKGLPTTTKRWVMDELAAFDTPPVDAIIKAGSRLYLGSKDRVCALDFDPAKKALTLGWQTDVVGRVVRLVAADERLFAVTREGHIYCFGANEAIPVRQPWKSATVPIDNGVQTTARKILTATGTRAGYALVLGAGLLAQEIVKQSDLRVTVIEPDPDKVLAWRQKWTAADLYGTRLAIVPGSLETLNLPPYLASLIVCDDPRQLGNAALVGRAFRSLRPYGGVLCVPTEHVPQLADRVTEAKLERAVCRTAGDLTLVARAGALPGAADWTHEHADAANTRVSKDQRVKAPLGVLWFGGPSHEGMLPRHGHGPQPQVIEGRIIIEGVDMLRTLDIYTGRLLWEAKLPGLGTFFNNTSHQPGANGSGSNYVCTPDGIYVAYNDQCLRLDPATGSRLAEYRLPRLDGMKATPRWGYIDVSDDYLIGGADPSFDAKKLPPAPVEGGGDDPEPGAERKTSGTLSKFLSALKSFSDNLTASKHLVVMDRHTGKVIWTATARSGFRHNAICEGGGRLYAIDRLSGDQLAALRRKGEVPTPPRLAAFDLKTGKEVWAAETEVFGTWLSYSEKHDILVEAGRVARDSLLDEPKGMRAYRGTDGRVQWFDKTYLGPAMIRGETVLQGQGARDLRTGALTLREDPITGAPTPWTWQRNYGCNTPVASEYLMTFRSGAAGYFDLAGDGGTGNFGGFRSSCTNNLIVAGGVICAPEYTRTCTCAYQNQTSIALVHTPEAEMWTVFGAKEVKGTVKHLGLNLGAPGDRRAADGTLWVEFPSVAGTSPAAAVTTIPAKAEYFRRHASQVTGPLNWVAASGALGLSEISVTLGKDLPAARSYRVRLVFMEPDKIEAGERVFEVALQGRTVLPAFDVVRAAGGPLRAIVKEFNGIEATDRLTVRLSPTHAQVGARPTILCGLEIMAEEKK